MLPAFPLSPPLWSAVPLRGGIRSLMASKPFASAKEVICGVVPKPFKAIIRVKQMPKIKTKESKLLTVSLSSKY